MRTTRDHREKGRPIAPENGSAEWAEPLLSLPFLTGPLRHWLAGRAFVGRLGLEVAHDWLLLSPRANDGARARGRADASGDAGGGGGKAGGGAPLAFAVAWVLRERFFVGGAKWSPRFARPSGASAAAALFQFTFWTPSRGPILG
ncbi:hypothetical protein MTO96_006428 [Rhipicephalus appendiculatus]